jgi:catechol 2,3-dioxygenase-like lactoylglutathione lyase family enzyme
MTTKTGTDITDIRTIAVAVSDQDRAVTFYQDALGFEKRMDAEFQPGFRWIEVAAPGATTSIAIVAAGEEQPAGVDTGIRLVSRDATADHTRLRERGVDVGDLLLWGTVPPMFEFRDPDGNVLYLVEDSPAS